MSGGIPSAANFMPSLTGAGNWVSNYEVGSAGGQYDVPSAPSLAAFNGGRPLVAQVRPPAALFFCEKFGNFFWNIFLAKFPAPKGVEGPEFCQACRRRGRKPGEIPVGGWARGRPLVAQVRPGGAEGRAGTAAAGLQRLVGMAETIGWWACLFFLSSFTVR